MGRLLITLALPFILCSTSSAFYLPGAAPKDYVEGEIVPVHVNRLNPMVSSMELKLVSLASIPFTHPILDHVLCLCALEIYD